MYILEHKISFSIGYPSDLDLFTLFPKLCITLALCGFTDVDFFVCLFVITGLTYYCFILVFCVHDNTNGELWMSNISLILGQIKTLNKLFLGLLLNCLSCFAVPGEKAKKN